MRPHVGHEHPLGSRDDCPGCVDWRLRARPSEVALIFFVTVVAVGLVVLIGWSAL